MTVFPSEMSLWAECSKAEWSRMEWNRTQQSNWCNWPFPQCVSFGLFWTIVHQPLYIRCADASVHILKTPKRKFESMITSHWFPKLAYPIFNHSALPLSFNWRQSDSVFCAIENNTVDIPLQKPVSRTEFSIFFQNSFFTELEIQRTIFSKKRIENWCINELLRAIWKLP